MARDDVGTYPHDCGNNAAIRKDKNGRLYLFCNHCGQDKRNLSGGQDLILTKGSFFGATSSPPPAVQAEEKLEEKTPAPPPPPPPSPEKRASGWHPII